MENHKKAAGYIIKRTATYENDITIISYVKSISSMITLGSREQAKVYKRKTDASADAHRIRRGISSEHYEVEPVWN